MLDAFRVLDKLANQALPEAKLAQVFGKTFGRKTAAEAGHGDR
jgi:hypothetical protein